MSRELYVCGTVYKWKKNGDYVERNGWISPGYSWFDTYKSKDEVEPLAVYDDNDERSPALWLADTIYDELGFVELGAGDTFTRSDQYDSYETSETASLCAVPFGFSQDELNQVRIILSSRQGTALI